MTTNAATLPTEPIGEARTPRKNWRAVTRISFRFAFCYWVLYCLPTIIYVIPGGRYVNRPFDWFWHKITPVVAQHLFHFSGAQVTYVPTGSGDTAFDFVQNFLFCVIAAAAAILWSLLDRKRADYGKLFAWLRVMVRFALAFTLLGYGLVKIFPTQFRPPDLSRLMETYGQSSPMGLLWTFMGASMPYTIFAGVAEATAGALLLFRRTTLLGALIAAGALLNVVMLNFCYDVPVKLYSTNLLLMAIFLLMPDISRLAKAFLLNRTAPAGEVTKPLFSRRWMLLTGRTLLAALVVYFVATTAWSSWSSFQRSETVGEPPIYGVYDIDSVQLNGRAAAIDDPANPGWTRVIADNGFWVTKDARGGSTYFAPHFSQSEVDLYAWKARSTLKLNYSRTDAQHLALTGYLKGEKLEVYLHKLDTGQFQLTHRGFHWISEYPFNR